jgi:uncharacterized RDD family membrane protein YckC
VDRRTLGSWLQGPGAVAPDVEQVRYPGERLGLPERGAGSIARFGARLSAFVLDALMCNAVQLLLFPGARWAVTAIFLVEVLVLTWLGGASAGQRLVRMRVVRVDTGGPIGLLRAVLRTALLALLIPALIWDRDQRGLHDRFAGTVLLRI